MIEAHPIGIEEGVDARQGARQARVVEIERVSFDLPLEGVRSVGVPGQCDHFMTLGEQAAGHISS